MNTYEASALVPIGEAARRLGVSIDTVRRWATDGLIAYTRTLGGQRRFDLDEIERVLNSRHTTPEGEAVA